MLNGPWMDPWMDPEWTLNIFLNSNSTIWLLSYDVFFLCNLNFNNKALSAKLLRTKKLAAVFRRPENAWKNNENATENAGKRRGEHWKTHGKHRKTHGKHRKTQRKTRENARETPGNARKTLKQLNHFEAFFVNFFTSCGNSNPLKYCSRTGGSSFSRS